MYYYLKVMEFLYIRNIGILLRILLDRKLGKIRKYVFV